MAETMKLLYSEATETMLYNMHIPHGIPVNISVFDDSDYAGNKVARSSHTVIMILINMEPIQWYSKRQNTVEASTFGAEFIALKIVMVMKDAVYYKLRMMNMPLKLPPG